MAVSKLSQIAPSPNSPLTSDTLIGVHGGNTDYQFTFAQVAALGLTTQTGPLTFYVAILAGTIVGGSGYTSGTYTNVSLTGGSSSGATADITVSGGGVTAVLPRSTGSTSGYVIGDVLSASNSNLGGTGSGFTFTLTAVGSDNNSGLSLAKAFRSISKSITTLAGYNFGPGFSVTVNVSDGYYDEQLQFGEFVGAFFGQITYIGNTTTRENVHVEPSTNPGASLGFSHKGVCNLNGCPGLVLQGFWFDANGASFGGWQCLSIYNGSIARILTCRMSLPDGDGWAPLWMDSSSLHLGAGSTDDNKWDLQDDQLGFCQITNNAFITFEANHSTIQVGASPTKIENNAWFFELNNHSQIVAFNNMPNAWVGWGGTFGATANAGTLSLRNGSGVIIDNADPTWFPGPNDAHQPTFGDNDTSVGAFFNHALTSGSTKCFGAKIRDTTLPAVSEDIQLFNNFGLFNWFPDANVTAGYNYFIHAWNDNGTAYYFPLSTKTTAYNYSQPTTGFTITLGNKDGRAIIDPSGSLTSGTVKMCPKPFDGQEVWVQTSQSITGLTVAANTGQTVVAAPTTLAGGAKFTAIYKSSNTTWYCAV